MKEKQKKFFIDKIDTISKLYKCVLCKAMNIMNPGSAIIVSERDMGEKKKLF